MSGELKLAPPPQGCIAGELSRGELSRARADVGGGVIEIDGTRRVGARASARTVRARRPSAA